MTHIHDATDLLPGESKVDYKFITTCQLSQFQEGIRFQIQMTHVRGGDALAIVEGVRSAWESRGVALDTRLDRADAVASLPVDPATATTPIIYLAFVSNHERDPSPGQYPDGYVVTGLSVCARGDVEDFPDWEH
jgi:hypothetical protein